MNFSRYYREAFDPNIINYCIRFLKERLPEIETAALGNEAGMIGAASLL